jgi:hypothetical protein
MGDESDSPSPDGQMLNTTVHLWQRLLSSMNREAPRETAAEGASMASWLETEIVPMSYSKTVWRR